MMGTGDFAVPTFRRLLDRGDRVRLLVTQPDRPQGRHQELVAATIKQLAIERGISVDQPEDVNTPEAIERLARFQPDLLIVAAYGQILSKSLLEIARLGGVNLHASLLPKYRGAAPINWAIYHGESVTGVSVIRMSTFLDAGGILLQAATPIGSEETAGELEVRLAELGGELILRAIDGLNAGTLMAQKQDRSLATRAPKLKKEDGLIDWRRSAAAVCNHVRAMQPWPMAYSFLHCRGREPERILVDCAIVETSGTSTDSSSAGIVTEAAGARLVVQCGDGQVRLDRLRPSGKRTMTAEELLRGRPIQPGDRFGSADEVYTM
jgi:methionyl-tRNA formyltransferase